MDRQMNTKRSLCL